MGTKFVMEFLKQARWHDFHLAPFSNCVLLVESAHSGDDDQSVRHHEHLQQVSSVNDRNRC